MSGSKLGTASDGKRRCGWASGSPLEREYHDREWGVPLHDDAGHFELITLEGAQAGLSWSTILRKREGYRSVFRGFDPAAVASMGSGDVERLLLDSGIVRHRGKIESTLSNAAAFLGIRAELGSFDRFVWAFVGGGPRVNRPRSPRDVPAKTPDSTRLSKELSRRGFRFVGPTTVYAYMQAAGLVNDHLTTCFRA